MDGIMLQLLFVIKSGKDVSLLENRGYDHFQIISTLEKMLEQGYIGLTDSGINITDLGLIQIKGLNEKLGNKDSDEWISVEIKSQIPKLEKEEVFVPQESDTDL